MKRRMYENELLTALNIKEVGQDELKCFSAFVGLIQKQESVITERDLSIINKWNLRVSALKKAREKNQEILKAKKRFVIKKQLIRFYRDFRLHKNNNDDLAVLLATNSKREKVVQGKKYILLIRSAKDYKKSRFVNKVLIRVIETNLEREFKRFIKKKEDNIIYQKEFMAKENPLAFIKEIRNAVVFFDNIK